MQIVNGKQQKIIKVKIKPIPNKFLGRPIKPIMPEHTPVPIHTDTPLSWWGKVKKIVKWKS